MRVIGRFLQFVGLFALPAAMLLELTGLLGRAVGLSQLILALVFGAAAFYLGRLLEGYAQEP